MIMTVWVILADLGIAGKNKHQTTLQKLLIFKSICRDKPWII